MSHKRSQQKKAPSLLQCALILLGVCVFVVLVNGFTSSGVQADYIPRGDATPTPWVCTPSPTPESSPTSAPTEKPTASPTPGPTAAPTPTGLPAAVLTATPVPSPAASHWVLNTGTMRFHKPDCKSVPTIKEKNRQDFTGTRDALIEQGYIPCGNCKP